MGDPKKQRKKYDTPNHPWEKTRIEEEKIILKEFGLKNKKEIWKMKSQLKNITAQIKQLIGMPAEKSELLKGKLQKKLVTLGLIEQSTPIEDAMNLSVNDLMKRRLQTLVLKKGLARSIDQSRQFITHEHISVSGKKITAPAYLVHIGEESTISFASNSGLNSADHPERIQEAPIKAGKKTVKKEKPKAEKTKEKADKPKEKKE